MQAFDLNALNRNLQSLLVGANEKLDALDVAGINASLVETSLAFERLAASPEIRQAFAQFPRLATQLGETLEQVQALVDGLEGTLAPVQVQVETTGAEAALTLQAIREAVEETQLLLSTDSGVGYRLEEALTGLAEAAEALRLLATSLEQNPGALLRGKEPPDEHP